ncbi:cysteine desulfurase family protein [Erythrobacter alti]|uniref:cysteine desulfurase family protein n=1 Tax=Erythrobacter alti TaxID=1896145 RepID=UPI0030F3CF9D
MIYLDYQATTPLAPEARDAMLKWLDGPDGTGFGNPHSPHRMGRMAAAAVDLARDQVAALFPPGGSVHFTGNACEAINLAMRGTVMKGGQKQGRVAISAIEHAAVRDTAMAIDDPVIMPVDRDGIADTHANLPGDTALVCIMQVNNEIGTVQPVAQIAERAREAGALVLCDAVQGAGKFAAPGGADMIAISAHKIYGPKGIGALWVRDGVDIDPQITGGLQERLRSGTLSTALCAGFGAAAALAAERLEADKALASSLWDRALDLFEGWEVNGSRELRNHANLSIRKDGLDVARLMSDCRDVMFSAGSACASGSGKPSHVLKAIGLSDAQAKSTIRLGWGRYSAVEDLEAAAKVIINAAAQQG